MAVVPRGTSLPRGRLFAHPSLGRFGFGGGPGATTSPLPALLQPGAQGPVSPMQAPLSPLLLPAELGATPQW